MKKLTKQQKEDYNSLSKSEKNIYDSIISSFPATNPDSVYDSAIDGGTNFQFICK